MKSSTIRLVVVLATLSIVGITITQMYWVKRAFNLKEAEFERTVNTALYNVAQEIFTLTDTPPPANNPVKQLSTNYFVVLVNGEIDANVLEFLLRTEFERRNLNDDFEYGIYDCSNEKMVYGNYIPMQAVRKNIIKDTNLPKWSSGGYYFGVQFPNRETQIINQMGIWSFSSIVLLLVIIFFCYTLFVILKQKRLSEIQNNFINTMTHEFKTPISTISISTEVLKDPDIASQPGRLLNYATIIEKENNRLKQHVERVLQIAKIDRGEVDLKREPVNMNELIHDAIKKISFVLQEKDGQIDCTLQANPLLVCDKLHVVNVLSNLLDNSIKYCTGQPRIRLHTRDEYKGLCLELEDNGIGIQPENQKKVFQKFYRVPTGNVHDVKGFGLGLSYVKTILTAHGGTIKLKSALGKGSLFTIWLPR